ncbi:MAG: class I SAM-dependent methyltransferase [Planctomycetia bacterium]|nr:class I SAM-dependent methyltransferase [Planctomycetia bacterium]
MDNAAHRRRDDCRLCGSVQLVKALPMPATPVGDAYVSADRIADHQATYPLDVWLCKDCGLAQLMDVVDPALLYVDYVYHTSVSLGLVDHFERYAADVVARIQPPSGGLAIDIGSNDGSLLQAFQSFGMTVLGVDPARDVARVANDRGIETLNTFFNLALAKQIRQERGPAALITANNVFANLDDLQDICSGIVALLSPDGMFVMETSYIAAVLEHMLVETIFHEHLSYFSLGPLIPFFRRVGLEIIDAQRQPTKGGSLRLTMQLLGAGRPANASVAAVLAAEHDAGIHTLAPFEKMGRHLTRIKAEVHKTLRDLKAAGKTIVGYGASVGAVTLLYDWELNGVLDFLVDDHLRKQNTFSPGQHIPVHAPEALYAHPADAVLILAWHYAEPIMRKHPDFKGEWVIPLPEVRTA